MDELLKLVSAGGDLGTVAVAAILLRHSGMLAELRAKIEMLERQVWTLCGHK